MPTKINYEDVDSDDEVLGEAEYYDKMKLEMPLREYTGEAMRRPAGWETSEVTKASIEFVRASPPPRQLAATTTTHGSSLLLQGTATTSCCTIARASAGPSTATSGHRRRVISTY